MTARDGGTLATPTSPERWPAGHRACLCFTIDVSAPGGTEGPPPFVPEPGYERTGAQRLLRHLADTDVTATFTWSRSAAVADAGLIDQVRSGDHEVAARLDEDRLPDDSWRDILSSLRNDLARIAGVEVVGCKAPGLATNPDFPRLAQQSGLRWLMDEPHGDLPTLLRPDLERPPVVHLPSSRWLDDRFAFVDNALNARQTFESWRDEVDTIREEGGLVCLTLHPSVSGRPGPSRAVAQLLDYAIETGDIWLARADHVALWWAGQHSTT